MKRYNLVERTNKAEIIPGVQSGKAGSSRENVWTKIPFNGP